MGDWNIQASLNDVTETICVVVYNELYQYSHVRFFESPEVCHDWIEYLLMQSDPDYISGAENE